MNIAGTLVHNPALGLANEGQARLDAQRELRAELASFVCDGQFGDAVARILENYLTNLDKPRQRGAWVSGFFGSGKSHLLKMVGHLWVNTPFDDGATARGLVPQLSPDVQGYLKELDGRAAKAKQPLVAATGTMPSGRDNQVRLTILGIILTACGYPEQYNEAKLCLWLREVGQLDSVKARVEQAGKDWVRELHHMYVSPTLAQAVLACNPTLADDEVGVRDVFRAQYPQLSRDDLTTSQFVDAAREALAGPGGALPLTVLVLDEVQQYIGNDADRASSVVEAAEALQTKMDSRVMLVASGQSALSATPILQKLQDRFRIHVQLSDADVERVTRQVLLQKKASEVAGIRSVLDGTVGEISKHLQGTRLAPRPDDQKTLVEDYPLLPTRRRFWEECFRAVDAAGQQSKLRSQLRILSDALNDVGEQEVGAVIPADTLFAALASEMVSSGILPGEMLAKILRLDDGTATGRLKSRLAGLVFLISRLPREAQSDTGVRATATMLADLLVEDLREDSMPLRRAVEAALDEMVEDGTLGKIGDEARLQTVQSAEWDRAFRERKAAMLQNDGELGRLRHDRLALAVKDTLPRTFVQGQSKVSRKIDLHTGPQQPRADGDGRIVFWLRDGWSTSHKEIEDDARAGGLEDPVIHIFIPRMAAEALRDALASSEAARYVLDTKGTPATGEGREARSTIDTRRQNAEADLDSVLREVLGHAIVRQGGGQEVLGASLSEKLAAAARASAERLFPRFGDADHGRWGDAVKQARDGADNPLAAIGWSGDAEAHPVVREVLVAVGRRAMGTETRRKLTGPPYGWPQDAVDAALILLARREVLRAQSGGQVVLAKSLDQSRIARAEFILQTVRLTTSEYIALRALFGKAGIQVASGEEQAHAGQYLASLGAMAEGAGGPPPLPAPPSTELLENLRRLTGPDQLKAILESKDVLESCRVAWTHQKWRAQQRLPDWRLAERLLNHAASLPAADQVRGDFDAILAERSLLDEQERMSPLRRVLGDALRAALQTYHANLERAISGALASLAASESWQRLDAATHQGILNRHRLVLSARAPVSTDEELVGELDRLPLAARDSELAAVPSRVTAALAEAARRSAPHARRLKLEPVTLESREDVSRWVRAQEERLLAAIEAGPIILGWGD